MLVEWRKWIKTIAISMSRYMAFKTDFFLMLVAPSLVFIAINYSIWYSVYRYRGGESVGGFSMEQMLNYQLWAFIAALLVRSHRTWNLSEHIRYGRITSFLLYPFDAWKFYASEFIAFQILQMGAAVVSLVCLELSGLLPPLDVRAFSLGIAFSLLASILWFVVDFTLGLFAFWLEEVWVFRAIFGLFAILCSGAFIPLELFPESMRRVLHFTPFPFLTSVPVNIFLGSESVSIVEATLTICGWIIALSLISVQIWRKGVRLYSAAGI